ncbi:hypothetical protein [Cognataquiflexum rubidum]|uniref:hypothetical protein n=1 Tax=Cognataquiflexum rubidum TaxID=2922273 RepID=UPI001F139656|nr:hypothetical protein [Cognataquiflexum rubidum]MCH6232753.1 hypothetical protein [Cognataquiflexum rubidum]
MLKQICIIFFFFIHVHGFAQENLRSDFLNQIFNTISDDPIKCSSEIPDWTYRKLREVLKTEGSGFSAKGKIGKCDISKEERKFLFDLIENTKIKAVSDFGSRLSESSKEDKTKIANMEGGQIFTFSEPVFFRDSSMVLFFQYRYCGSKCAEGRWSIYFKDSGEWNECLVLLSMVS